MKTCLRNANLPKTKAEMKQAIVDAGVTWECPQRPGGKQGGSVEPYNVGTKKDQLISSYRQCQCLI